VRDASRELPYRFHLLCLDKLFLRPLVLAHIVDNDDEDRFAILLGFADRKQHRKIRAILASALDLPAGPFHLANAGDVKIVVPIRRRLNDGLIDVLPNDLFAPIAEQVQTDRIAGLDASSLVDLNDAIDDRLDQCMDLFPGLANLPLGFAAFGDVAGDLGKADQPPVPVP